MHFLAWQVDIVTSRESGAGESGGMYRPDDGHEEAQLATRDIPHTGNMHSVDARSGTSREPCSFVILALSALSLCQSNLFILLWILVQNTTHAKCALEAIDGFDEEYYYS